MHKGCRLKQLHIEQLHETFLNADEGSTRMFKIRPGEDEYLDLFEEVPIPKKAIIHIRDGSMGFNARFIVVVIMECLEKGLGLAMAQNHESLTISPRDRASEKRLVRIAKYYGVPFVFYMIYSKNRTLQRIYMEQDQYRLCEAIISMNMEV
jgi:hypothetical protein